MSGVAKDFSSFMLALMSDADLTGLMGVPLGQNLSQMIDKYFCETVTSGVITTAAICRVIITANPQISTNNLYIKEDMLSIEVYVPNTASSTPFKDRMMPSLERRSNLIVDEIIKLFNNKLINDRRLRLEARHELASGTPGFCRMFVQFSYKRVYS
ncbi:hypothetical protein [Clostridium estertheticum]|uniref:hypothetical protein n=1 Tax=Clostridium estertheticum TaxID=238834 RepID=UPI001C0BC044|nr:hypothetical protein [Clostridium estertheticum]MBU3186654.1 hypothetical protein [Clostridium estertheticum]